jgi:hypothetical protein
LDAIEFFKWVIIVTGVSFILFMVAGGGFAQREKVPGAVRTTILTMYKKLPPPPDGPSYCSILDYGDRGLVLPCDFKPPFIGWLQGGKY